MLCFSRQQNFPGVVASDLLEVVRSISFCSLGDTEHLSIAPRSFWVSWARTGLQALASCQCELNFLPQGSSKCIDEDARPRLRSGWILVLVWGRPLGGAIPTCKRSAFVFEQLLHLPVQDQDAQQVLFGGMRMILGFPWICLCEDHAALVRTHAFRPRA